MQKFAAAEGDFRPRPGNARDLFAFKDEKQTNAVLQGNNNTTTAFPNGAVFF